MPRHGVSGLRLLTQSNSMNPTNHSPPTPGCIAVIMPAAGSGQRFGSAKNKLFAMLGGDPIWFRSAMRMRDQTLVGRIVMPVSESDRASFETDFASLVRQAEIEIVRGGQERCDSVRAGIESLDGDQRVRWIAVHDAARPLVSDSDLAAVFAIASQTGAAILATPVAGTVKRSIEIFGSSPRTQTVDRRDLYIAQTPQVFDAGLLRTAYQKHNGRPATDDAELVERLGQAVAIVRGTADNIKITYPEDLTIAQAILDQRTT